MKRIISKIGVAAVVGLAMVWAIPAGAQAPQMRVDVPFAFLAGGGVHSAGAYTVYLDEAHHVVEFRAVGRTDVIRVVLGNGLGTRRLPEGSGVLRFRQYGETYALSGIWSGGLREGYGFKPTKAENELARASAGTPGEISLATQP